MANGGGVRGVHFRKMIYHRGWIEKAREKSVDPWGLVYRRGTRNRERERERRDGRESSWSRGPTLITTPPNFLVIIWWFQQRDRISSRIPERAFHLDNQSPPRMPRAQSFLPILNSRFFLFFQRIFGRHDRIESQDLEAIVRMKEIVITTEGESCSHFFFYFFFLRK